MKCERAAASEFLTAIMLFVDAAQWSSAVSRSDAFRRAAGRRRYNFARQVDAVIRRHLIVLAWDEHIGNGGCFWDRGWRAQMARDLGVHRSTITRDFDIIWAHADGYVDLLGRPVGYTRAVWSRVEH